MKSRTEIEIEARGEAKKRLAAAANKAETAAWVEETLNCIIDAYNEHIEKHKPQQTAHDTALLESQVRRLNDAYRKAKE